MIANDAARREILEAAAELHVRLGEYVRDHELTRQERTLLTAATSTVALIAEVLDRDEPERLH